MLPSLIALLAALLVGVLLYWLVFRPRFLRWGATDEEVRRPLPGDEFLPSDPKLNATHAITINTAAAHVWPWLVQMGQNRGGFYSYTWLENLIGCRIRNADRIVPEWQSLEVGDHVILHPKTPPLPVIALEPGRLLTLKGWGSFYLRQIDERTTRLVIRSRAVYEPDIKNFYLRCSIGCRYIEMVHFIMERKMLLGIKQRAEATASQTAATRPVRRVSKD